jgi:hypothetical protein
MITLWDLTQAQIIKSKIKRRLKSAVHWRMLFNIYKGENRKDFFKEIKMTNIVQGELGNCWLISSIAALTKHPHKIKSLFIRDHKLEELGLYKGNYFTPKKLN